MKSIFIAGGGSGGHITPGLALAEQCLACHVHPILLHAPRSIDREMLASEAFDAHAIPASPPSLHPKPALRCLLGYLQSRQKLRRLAGLGCKLGGDAGMAWASNASEASIS
ncbi:MAG: glycosyltransferase, partial [Planctomycetota bacterium]